ncbi:hypothetical protein PRK78_001523 [Emydomyces testavorans]|uniref:Uncharacterized protein n=1 Tax=Emydomyces testavorans TaxID=2070801 RepID=A0AAF0DD18_9EURO|nr:hypothetical protein PRK78_001523 [Emydomyces testavorans]
MLRESSTLTEFLPCLLVCRQFNLMGSLLLCMNRRSVPKRLPIKSLTLCLGVKDPNIAGYSSGIHPNLNELLWSLSDIILRDFYVLRSFSLHINAQAIAAGHHDPDYVELLPIFDYSCLVSLLEALPRTCVDLELDTAGIEGYQNNEHLCGHIAKLLPQLHHLRLRMRNVCSKFIDVPDKDEPRREQPLYPRLRTLIINTDISVGPVTSTSPCNQAYHQASLHAELVPFLRDGVATGSLFPSLKRLQVYSRQVLEEGFPEFAIRVSDIFRYETHMLPSLYLPNFEDNFPRVKTWRFIRTIDGRDIIAPRAKALEILENSWKFTTEGARFPVDTNIHQFGVDAFSALRLHWEKDPPAIDLRTYINHQQQLFKVNSAEYKVLLGIHPSKYVSVTFLGLRELPDEFGEPLVKPKD